MRVIEKTGIGAAGIWRQLAMRPGRLEYALRLALICALTCLVGEIYQTPDIALTIYIVFFLNQKNRPASLITACVFVVLITIVIGLIFVVADIVLDEPMWRVAAMAAISFGCLFLASASKLRPIGGIIALIIGYALDLLGLIPVGELATRALLYAWLFVGIPAGVSIVVNLLIAPSPRAVVEQELALRLRLAAKILRNGREACGLVTEALREGVAALLHLLKLAQIEHSLGARETASLHQGILSSAAILSSLDVTAHHPQAFPPAAFAEPLARSLAAQADALERGEFGSPVFSAAMAPGMSLPAQLVADQLRVSVEGFWSTSSQPPEVAKKERTSFFLADAFSNPDHVRFALKTTSAAMFCYVLYSLIDWPGIHTCFITCFIVSLTTVGESVEKLTLRILGCLIGASTGFAAILFLIPHLTGIAALMAVVFMGTALAGYVAACGPRISYAGYQIAFAFLLCVVQGSSPAFDFIVARDRVIGIILGNVVSYLVFANIWPVSVARRIDPALRTTLQHLACVAGQGVRESRVAGAAAIRAEIGTIESDLELARYEPDRVRPPGAWLASRKAVTRDLAVLSSLVSTAPVPQAVAEDLARLAAEFGSGHLAEVIVREAPEPWSAILDAKVVDLRSALRECKLEGGSYHAPA